VPRLGYGRTVCRKLLHQRELAVYDRGWRCGRVRQLGRPRFWLVGADGLEKGRGLHKKSFHLGLLHTISCGQFFGRLASF